MKHNNFLIVWPFSRELSKPNLLFSTLISKSILSDVLKPIENAISLPKTIFPYLIKEADSKIDPNLEKDYSGKISFYFGN